jgi:hypothetical protein
MNCPHCACEMQAGTVRVSTSAIGGWYGFLTVFSGVMQYPRSLYFTPSGETYHDVIFTEEVPRAGHRCQQCHAVVLLALPPPLVLPPKSPQWLVRIAEHQETKATRRAVYDCLRKHRIPHPVASPKASVFHGGLQVEIPLQECHQAKAIVDDMRHLGLAAEVVEPS